MHTLYITLLCIFLMLAIVPLHASLAVSATSSLSSHFLYMFGHASYLHWAVNSWCLLMAHRQFRPLRIGVAYVASVLLSFLYYPSLPVLGASVFISFFMGISTPWLYRYSRVALLQMLIFLVVGCLLPHIAGTFHLVLFLLGFVYAKTETLIHNSQQLNV